jgi:hypothetical protein
MTKRVKTTYLDLWIMPLWPLVLVLMLAFASDLKAASGSFSSDRALTLEQLSINSRVVRRAPSNFVADDEVVVVPFRRKTWIKRVMVEDDAGVMVSMRRQVESWHETKQYVDDWDLDNMGIHEMPSKDTQTNYLTKMMLKYVDKRISGEVKRAPKGSTLAQVGQVQKKLRPAAKFKVNDYFKVKFKARVLRGKAIMLIENPFMQLRTDFYLSGKVNVNANRDFKLLGVKTNIDYEVHNSRWVASVQKQLTDNISANISSHQDDDVMIFSNESDNRFQLIFNQPF